jgi:hypothetical protein
VLFIVATSVVTFPLAFVRVLPVGFVLIAVMLLTLAYFAVVDTLHVGRLAGYVAILEAPPAPIIAAVEPSLVTLGPATAKSVQHSGLSIQPETTMVDQDELILSDRPEANVDEPSFANTKSSLVPGVSKVDQNELILGDRPQFDPDQQPPKANES